MDLTEKVLEKGKIFVYDDDFLQSDDVSSYFGRNDSFPDVLKIKEKYYWNPREGKKKTEISESKVRRYTEGVPLDLYSYWQDSSPGERTGLAVICFRDRWYLAVRVDDRYEGRNNFGEHCSCVDQCRIAVLKELCKRPELEHCIFIYSTMHEAPAWPPKGARLWCLFPFHKIERDEDLDFVETMMRRLPCERWPEECTLYQHFSQAKENKQ